jgi:hypothetical protein
MWRLLQSGFTSVTATVTCSEHSVFETDTLEDVLSFENPSYRHINELELSARSSSEERATLRFSEDGMTAGLVVYSENDAKALHTATELMLLVAEAKPVYSFVTRIKASTSVIVAMAAYSVADTLWHLVVHSQSAQPNNISVELITLAFAGAALSWLLLRPLDRLQNWLFPRLFFVIGRQEDELRLREQWRSIVFSGFAVSVFASLVAALIWKVLGR